MTQRPEKLLNQVRACPEPVEGMQFGSRAVAGQCRHDAYSTEKTYVQWTKRFVLYHIKLHSLEMGEREINGFLAGQSLQVRSRFAQL